MPEGPAIRFLCEKAQPFVKKKVQKVSGKSQHGDVRRMEGLIVQEITSFGKQLLIRFDKFNLRVHLMLFGYFRINEKKETGKLTLGLEFENGELNFYASDIRFIERALSEVYDWSIDVMNAKWDAQAAVEKLNNMQHTLACDALLDQDIFAGVGNKIKDEVLFITRVHPESIVVDIPDKKKKEIAGEVSRFSFKYLDWKRTDSEEAHFQAHFKQICPRDQVPLKKQKLGSNRRTSYFCDVCQKKY
jgi:endonuclease VIII